MAGKKTVEQYKQLIENTEARIRKEEERLAEYKSKLQELEIQELGNLLNSSNMTLDDLKKLIKDKVSSESEN